MTTTEQVKFFDERDMQCGRESNSTDKLQETINSWLTEHPTYEIVHRRINITETGLLIVTLFYIEKSASKKPARTASSPRAKGRLKRVK